MLVKGRDMDPSVATTPQKAPENKEAVIAIQGGGLYALPMLGQVRVVLAAGYIPLGFAGNSGGAILATLLWAGLTPDRIQKAFLDALETPDGLTRLLLPKPPARGALTLAGLDRLRPRAAKLLPLPRGIFSLPLYLLKNIAGFFVLPSPVATAWESRGFFPGGQLTDFLETLICEGLGRTKTGTPVTFGEALGRARPILLLTMTNVASGRLELIDSTDPRYAKVSIAAAVRASAGFPAFFQPTRIDQIGGGQWFVDGGMISNFPLWAFSRQFRAKLQQRKDYGWLAPRPWLPIGIRVVEPEAIHDVAGPTAFIRRLIAIATGMARNDMENRLVDATVDQRLIIEQDPATLPINPKTKRPIGFLEIDALTKDNLKAVIQSGSEAATRVLATRGGFTVYNQTNGTAIERELEALVRRCEHAMLPALAASLRLRANIFIAIGKTLHLCFSARMVGMVDATLSFPLESGVTGWCYQTRSPAICNMKIVAHLAVSQSAFELDDIRQREVDRDLTWLISYPIFDPAERQVLTTTPVAAPSTFAPGLHRLRADTVGPIFGILNVDAAWDYAALALNESPDLHWDDIRIVGVTDAVAQSSLRLARLLAGSTERRQADV